MVYLYNVLSNGTCILCIGLIAIIMITITLYNVMNNQQCADSGVRCIAVSSNTSLTIQVCLMLQSNYIYNYKKIDRLITSH